MLPALARVDAELTPAQREKWQGIRDLIQHHAEATIESLHAGD